MITLLADSNSLRHPGLEEFLRASRSHAIGLSDWTINEMQKKNALSTSRGSLRTIAKFPQQVFLIRQTHELLNERLYSSADTPNILDYEGAVELIALAQDLQRVPVPLHLPAQMTEAQERAVKMMTLLKQECMDLEAGMQLAAKEFTKNELTNLRKGPPIPEHLTRKLFDLLLVTAGDFMIRNQQKGGHKPMKVKEAMSMFGFRYCLCCLIYYLDWVRIGRQTGLDVDRRVNDVIDMQVAAVATFFGGVLSRDRGLQQISNTARQLLRMWGAFVGEDWSVPKPPG